MERLEKNAIEILHMMCERSECIICDSGGKDSSVLKHIALQAKEKYGLQFRVRHNHTTVDAPETVYFVREEKRKFEQMGIPYEIHYPKESIGQVSEQEMKNIDIALMISLQLDGDSKSHKQYNETIKKQQEEIDSLKREIETLQQECDDRIAEIEQDAAVYVEENRKVDASRQSEDIIKVQTERDTFKALYEQLFERLLTMGGTGN